MSAHTEPAHAEDQPPALPLVVRVGFSGSRLLAEHSRDDTPAAREWLATLRQALHDQLAQLPQALGLSAQHFIVGQSQLAVGADTLFTECLQQLGWAQRVLLPQPRAAFLAAGGSQGPDFLPHERQQAEALFAAPHLIDEAVVGGTGTRAERFDESNLRILGESDLLVCLRIEQPAGKTGGVQQLIERAGVRQLPVLELVLEPDAQGRPTLQARWHRRERFSAPRLPPALARIAPLARPAGPGLPSFTAYAERLKTHTSSHAGQLRDRFAAAATVIVGTHAAATVVASLALTLPHALVMVAGLVLLELALLASGLWKHLQLHHQGATADWALARLSAEIGRSALALDAIPGALQALQWLPFPDTLAPVLRTLTTLHLAQHHRATAADFGGVLQGYLARRVRHQQAYYDKEQHSAQARKDRADRIFTWLSALAIAAVLLKLAATAMPALGPLTEGQLHLLANAFGVCAVALPVLAVAVVSLAAAFDLEARASTFHAMHGFLIDQAAHVEHAGSPRELALLATTIEARLLGETLSWYSRRVFTGVA